MGASTVVQRVSGVELTGRPHNAVKLRRREAESGDNYFVGKTESGQNVHTTTFPKKGDILLQKSPVMQTQKEKMSQPGHLLWPVRQRSAARVSLLI